MRRRIFLPSYETAVANALAIAVTLWFGLAIALVWAVARDFWTGAPVAPSKDLVGPIVTGTGVLIAVFAFLRDREKITNDRRDAKSKVLYEQASAGLVAAFDLLKDQNNDRITWVRAARLIAGARKLAESIESKEYQHAYQLALDEMRSRLYEALTIRGSAGQRDALPPAFFFGHPDWKTCVLTLDELAQTTSPRMRVYSVSEDTVVPDFPNRNLAERSVQVVMGLLQYPSDYDDPLDGTQSNSHASWPEGWGPMQGAQRYLNHREKFVAIGGKLIAKGPTKE